jgi:hypothetical protein
LIVYFHKNAQFSKWQDFYFFNQGSYDKANVKN